MEDSRTRAYTYLFYRVFLDIRSTSYAHQIEWWKPKSMMQLKKDMAEINNIADAFHNLPDLLVNRADDFDEVSFWNGLNKILPDKYELYHRIFNEELQK